MFTPKASGIHSPPTSFVPCYICRLQQSFRPWSPRPFPLATYLLPNSGRLCGQCSSISAFDKFSSPGSSSSTSPLAPRRLLLGRALTTRQPSFQVYCKSRFYYTTMTSATANAGEDDELRSKPQQSPLASQRAKQNNTPTEANRAGKSGGYFPLGYKEAYSQWV